MGKKGSAFSCRKDGKSEPLTMPYLMAFMTFLSAPGLERVNMKFIHSFIHSSSFSVKIGKKNGSKDKGIC